jgi:hypothetical protein
VCTSISCFLNGGDELLEHAEQTLQTKVGGTTDDGLITLEGYECIAACTEAPCLQVNYRYFHRVSNSDFDHLVNELRSGRRQEEIPPHGTLARIRQRVDPERVAGAVAPSDTTEPVWLGDTPALQDAESP